MPEPPHVGDLDEELKAYLSGMRKVQIRLLIGAIVLIVCFIGGTAFLIVQQQGLSNDTTCQVRYNEAYAKAQVIRSNLTDRSNDATTALIESVFTVSPGETKSQESSAIEKAYRTYYAAQTQIKKERTEHPVPKVPHC